MASSREMPSLSRHPVCAPIAAVAACVLALAIGALPAAAKARARHHLPGAPVPAGFVGMNTNAPLFISGDGLSLADQFAAMARSGVQSVRIAFNWGTSQPYASWADVPSGQAGQFVDAGGVPTNFTETDQIVLLASLYGLRLLPVVLYAPSWDSATIPASVSPPPETGVPASPAPYANYLTALIERYGPHGTFWQQGAGPRRPIRQWQIWNEPNFFFFWNQPSLTAYAALLRASHAAIKAADPGAKTVLGALTNISWGYLAQLYRIPGMRSTFDEVAVNEFSSTPARVVRILGAVRRTMNRFGDARKPLLDTELSWTTAHGTPGGVFDWDTTPAGQARNVAAIVPLLAAHRRALGLAGFFYYTWVDDESNTHSDWNFAGLLRVVGGQAVPKPALSAFTRAALAIER